ncbi:MAG: signal peptidase I [Firmicutes bacterium]|nr:signal peptidase I [Bacillota bacterium]
MPEKPAVRETIESLATAVLIVTFITVFAGRLCRVKGPCMEPALYTGQWLWTDKIGYALGQPRRGDIVVFKYHETKDKYIKRLIGLPGETIQISGGRLLVNGVRIEEPYSLEPSLSDYGPVTVPPDSYFVLGDNRNHSDDSRGSVGFLPRGRIEGRAVARLWPVWQLRVFERPKYETNDSTGAQIQE